MAHYKITEEGLTDILGAALNYLDRQDQGTVEDEEIKEKIRSDIAILDRVYSGDTLEIE